MPILSMRISLLFAMAFHLFIEVIHKYTRIPHWHASLGAGARYKKNLWTKIWYFEIVFRHLSKYVISQSSKYEPTFQSIE